MTFDQIVNMVLWLLSWWAFAWYGAMSRLVGRDAGRRLVQVLVVLYLTTVLIKLGVPGGDSPFVFWNP